MGGSKKKAHKEEDKPPAELVFNTALDLTSFRRISACWVRCLLPHGASVDCVLLYYVEDQLESALHEVPLVFTDEELAITARQ